MKTATFAFASPKGRWFLPRRCGAASHRPASHSLAQLASALPTPPHHLPTNPPSRASITRLTPLQASALRGTAAQLEQQHAQAISSTSALPTTRTSLPFASASCLSTTSAAVASFDSKLQENLAAVGADASVTSEYFSSLPGNQLGAPRFDLSTSAAVGETDANLPIAESTLLEPASPAPAVAPAVVAFSQKLSSMLWKVNRARSNGGSRSSSVSTVAAMRARSNGGSRSSSVNTVAAMRAPSNDGSRSSSVGNVAAMRAPSNDASRSSSVSSVFAMASLDDASEAPECATCWGAHINGAGVTCSPEFVPGQLHFQNKICASCKDSLIVPTSRVCVLTAKLAECFVNRRSEGFWNYAPASMGGGQYRIINNTAGCIGPRLALFKGEPPPCDWPALPEQWVTDDGFMRLCVAKGTLVPAMKLSLGRSQVIRIHTVKCTA